MTVPGHGLDPAVCEPLIGVHGPLTADLSWLWQAAHGTPQLLHQWPVGHWLHSPFVPQTALIAFGMPETLQHEALQKPPP